MAFKMNRPIIKGTPLQKNTGNNPNDLRPNMGGNTLGIKDRGELSEWYAINSEKDNFGYNTYEDFKKDWPNADMQGGYATTFEGGPEYMQKFKSEKTIKLSPRPIEQIAVPEKEEPALEKVDMPEIKSFKDRVKDVSLSYDSYGAPDDADVTDKHGRYFTLTLKDGSKMRLAPETYRNYFGTESLMNPGKQLRVFDHLKRK
uniref:Uncharacterized protein n=1 Tax=Virus NIOZ-UU157 TaxID=2763269 RepID=A0A7S9SU75_9VIRU|nr:MAG: hypothetical protein NIOZUU157_00399 [Virus NIOZ-UU157]